MTDKVTVYYNGGCPVCSREIAHYQRRTGEGEAIGWCDIDAGAPTGLDGEAVRRRLHVLDGSGRMHIGAEAFAVLWERVPGYRWLARLVRLPGIRSVAAWVYDHLLAAPLYAWDRRRRARRTP